MHNQPTFHVQGELDSEAHRNRIFAVHVAEFQKQLKSEQPAKYKKVFSKYIKV